MRAYVAPDGKTAKYAKQNVPPKAFLPMSVAGFNEGSFAMIMGFPGRTPDTDEPGSAVGPR
jgi:hypothetical protein